MIYYYSHRYKSKNMRELNLCKKKYRSILSNEVESLRHSGTSLIRTIINILKMHPNNVKKSRILDKKKRFRQIFFTKTSL
jgi:hypothetical protein